MMVWAAGGLAVLGLLLAGAYLVLTVRVSRRTVRARDLLRSAVGTEARDASVSTAVLGAARLLARRPEDFRALADFAARGGCPPQDAILVLEVFLAERSVSEDTAPYFSTLAGLYAGAGRSTDAVRLLDALRAHGRSGPADLKRRARIAMEKVDTTPFGVAVCEETLAAARDSDPAFASQLRAYLAEYYGQALRLAGPLDVRVRALAGQALVLFEELDSQAAADEAHHQNIILCHWRLEDYEKCHLACRAAQEVFGESILGSISVVWASALLGMVGWSGFAMAAVAKTCERAGLGAGGLLRVFEEAYRRTARGDFLGPLAHLSVSTGRFDGPAVDLYEEALGRNLLEPAAGQVVFRHLVQRNQWERAVALGLRLAAQSPEEGRWPAEITQCLLRLGRETLTADEAAAARRALDAFAADPAYHQLLLLDLLARQPWSMEDVHFAIRLEEKCGGTENAQKLRESLLRWSPATESPAAREAEPSKEAPAEVVPVAQTRAPTRSVPAAEASAEGVIHLLPGVLRRWWSFGGRDETIAERFACGVGHHVAGEPVLLEIISWLVWRGHVHPDLCALLLHACRRSKWVPEQAAVVASALEQRWQSQRAFTRDDVRAFMEMRESHMTPSAPAFRKCIEALLDAKKSAKAEELLGDFLLLGYFDRDLVTRMLPEIKDTSLERSVRRAMLANSIDIFRSAVWLLRQQKDGRAEDPQEIAVWRAALTGAFHDEAVSNEEREVAWRLLEPQLVRDHEKLTFAEEQLVLLALDNEWISLSRRANRQACQALCERLLGTRPADGILVARCLVEDGEVPPKLALCVLKAAKQLGAAKQ